MDESDGFLGTWELVPELSLFEVGDRPASGWYEIVRAGNGIEVRIRWTMEPSGPERSTGFGGEPDGRSYPLGAGATGPGPDAFSLTRVDSRTLDSAALRQGAVVAYARRAASLDGQLLAVVQEGNRLDGGRFRNFEVYRRINLSGQGPGNRGGL